MPSRRIITRVLSARPTRILVPTGMLAAIVLTCAATAPAGCSAGQQDASSNGGQLSGSGMSAFEQCVITRESSGRPQVMNSSGHYGLFQFDYSTWVSGGGSPGDFGHASVQEQQQVFDRVYAARGTEPWAPYDGC